MMAQGVLGFQYEGEGSASGMTSLAGLPVYLELVRASGLVDAIREHIGVAGKQGWLDVQMVLALVFLNLAGGDCVEDIERLEADGGFAEVLRRVERELLTRRERREMKDRWRRDRERTLPSPASILDWLERHHDPEAEAHREAGKAFIPALTTGLRGLWSVNQALLAFEQSHHEEKVATLDMDATLVETYKRQALHCYKGFKAYQPLNCWWAEQGVVVYSEFRDGNVPAGYEQLRVLKEGLARLPATVRKVYLRSDSAGYQQDLLLYCGEGKDRRFGAIEFAVSADVTQEFRTAVRALEEKEWQPLYREVPGSRPGIVHHEKTGQEWAEVGYVPNWVGYSKNRKHYRFLAVREPMRQRELPLDDPHQLPFPTEEFGAKGTYKLFGIVTNRALPGDQVIWWLRERCGKSEEAHAVMKDDFAGGRMPSGKFGANAAWWALMILALNLNAVMKRLVLGKGWLTKRMKAVRFHLIALPARVIRHARRLILRVSAAGEAVARLLTARKAIRALALGPAG
jgi:Transposase DDE domain group 1